MIFQVISFTIFLGYAALIITITIGWCTLKVFKRRDSLLEIKVSVVIAVRNEELNITNLLNNLLKQDYPNQLFEIIIVDDHSTDKTSRIVENYIELIKDSKRLKLIKLDKKNGFGKKAALNRGIQVSEGELIIITDADCTSGNHWISTIASFYDTYKPQMILGPVRMTGRGSMFGKFQSLEFMSLISSSAGSCNAGFPLLANGANIAFTCGSYNSCGGFTGNMRYPSGDDMFLMMSIKKKFGSKAIRFLRSEEAVINTPATKGFKSFFQQRLRWVSKSRGYTDPFLIIASLLVFLTNGWLVATAFAVIFFSGYIKIFLILYFLKLIIDLPVMIGYSRFQRSASLLWLFPLLELLNAVYTIVIGFAGNVAKYEWKGRSVSPKRMDRG